LLVCVFFEFPNHLLIVFWYMPFHSIKEFATVDYLDLQSEADAKNDLCIRH